MSVDDQLATATSALAAGRWQEARAAAELTERALEVGRAAGDVDLELAALAQLGLVRVAQGDPGADRLTDEVYRRIREGAHEVLRPFTTPDGRVEAPFESNVVTATRP